jgi:hypothetical protein
MKRTIAAAAMTALLAVAGCGRETAPSAPAAEDAAAAAVTAQAASADSPALPEPPAVAGQPAAPGAPSFAVIYPGGTPNGPPTVAQGPSGPGGIVSFTTRSSPEAVIDWYRKAAEASGLTSVMAMNQGDARAYGAAAEDGSGKLLRVVATPVEDGGSDVQLDWTAGK